MWPKFLDFASEKIIFLILHEKIHINIFVRFSESAMAKLNPKVQ